MTWERWIQPSPHSHMKVVSKMRVLRVHTTRIPHALGQALWKAVSEMRPTYLPCRRFPGELLWSNTWGEGGKHTGQREEWSWGKLQKRPWPSPQGALELGEPLLVNPNGGRLTPKSLQHWVTGCGLPPSRAMTLAQGTSFHCRQFWEGVNCDHHWALVASLPASKYFYLYLDGILWSTKGCIWQYKNIKEFS